MDEKTTRQIVEIHCGIVDRDFTVLNTMKMVKKHKRRKT